jgi:glycine/D-amino acid oxidase-like deaminating enzyme
MEAFDRPSLPNQAEAVVIGAGALGLSVALHLAELGMRDVLVLDQYEPASQTSPRAAGLFKLIQPDETRTRISQRSIGEALTFEDTFGVPLPVKRSGSLLAARTPEHAAMVQMEVERSRGWGVDVELVSAEEARRLVPYLDNAEEILAAAWTPGDVYIEEPASLLTAFMAAAERLGVSILGQAPVTGVDVHDGSVHGVKTPHGVVTAPLVVDAAGAWARLVGRLAGADVPVAPTRHQLFITEPVSGIDPMHPITRIVDAAVYLRPSRGGLMLGGFEADPLAIPNAVTEPNFSMGDVPLDFRVMERLRGSVQRQAPDLEGAEIAEHRGGLFTMTPDGRFLAGPVPGVRGLWTATGCNGSGFSSSPGIGAVLAEWIVDGEPTIDLSILTPERFVPGSLGDEELVERGRWQYAHYYDPGASEPA